jgi:pimeloyl-ACP methyl ester carboxylesterase
MSLLRVTLGVAICLPVFLSITFYLLQERIVFQPAPISGQRLDWIRENFQHIEEINLMAPDGVNLHGWLAKDTGQIKSSLLIYFGGNGEEVSGTLVDTHGFKGWSLLTVNYRGYGLSEGVPSEEKLFKDAFFIYDSLAGREDIDALKVVAMGKSLGTGVAVYLATQRPLTGVILVSPYDSVAGIVKEKYPFVPVNYLLRHPFDSIKLVPSVNVPMLALVATEDKLVPPWRSQRLVDAWGGKSELKLVEGKNHATIHSHEVYWESIGEFLAGL